MGPTSKSCQTEGSSIILSAFRTAWGKGDAPSSPHRARFAAPAAAAQASVAVVTCVKMRLSRHSTLKKEPVDA